MNYGTTTRPAPDAAASVHQNDDGASRLPSSKPAASPASRSPDRSSVGSGSGSDSGPGPEAGGPEPPSPRDAENEEGGDEEGGEERGQQRWRNRAWGDLKGFYQRNIGLFFVFLAQTFGSIVRLLLLSSLLACLLACCPDPLT